jgi:hypothetical protein
LPACVPPSFVQLLDSKSNSDQCSAAEAAVSKLIYLFNSCLPGPPHGKHYSTSINGA